MDRRHQEIDERKLLDIRELYRQNLEKKIIIDNFDVTTNYTKDLFSVFK